MCQVAVDLVLLWIIIISSRLIQSYMNPPAFNFWMKTLHPIVQIPFLISGKPDKRQCHSPKIQTPAAAFPVSTMILGHFAPL
ncbi:hypothetical protein BDV38DRAFT_234672 [Aspergillus pseudotamarii]|uniref:Secreted protein n=1 Tax=Aspergillus pseudotamarii TaxID=132259 RepID=A0A5N6TA81_ASPPS|nr:uncharacterized protein BDV38DRAFT_234672 [Aspergillus pseudotamarii]KAE8143089.1 hypothetical protein BDV38DRAFT_234672 [Aspergillus pseudotamarii]